MKGGAKPPCECVLSAAAATAIIAVAASAVVIASAAVPAVAEEYDDKDNEPEAAIVASIAEHS